jgi:hypothetical protein
MSINNGGADQHGGGCEDDLWQERDSPVDTFVHGACKDVHGEVGWFGGGFERVDGVEVGLFLFGLLCT